MPKMGRNEEGGWERARWSYGYRRTLTDESRTSSKKRGRFLEKRWTFSKKRRSFFFAAQRDCFFSLQMRTLAVKRTQWFTAAFSHFTSSFILTTSEAPLFHHRNKGAFFSFYFLKTNEI